MKKILALLLALLLIFSLAACGKTTEEEETKKEEITEEATNSDIAAEAGNDSTETSLEDVDLSTFTFGVTEDGDNVVVTVKNTTAVGDVACVMTYVYEDGKLTKSTADYYVPDAKMAEALAQQLKQDSSIVADSVKVDGACVSCQIVDSELEELRQLTREELIQAMEYAIATTQGQTIEVQPAE